MVQLPSHASNVLSPKVDQGEHTRAGQRGHGVYALA